MKNPFETKEALMYWYGQILKEYTRKPKRAHFQLIKMFQDLQTSIDKNKPNDFFEITGIAQNVSYNEKGE